MAKRQTERGFTLIEMMVAVAVLGILAAIVIPSFIKDSRKGRSKSEVQSVFSDLRTRMDQYFQENGQYPATIGEGTLFPASPSSTKQSIITSMPTAWTALKVRISGSDMVNCGYTWVTGAANTGTNIGAVAAAAPFNFTAPVTAWYYLLARCNLDNSATVDTYYVSTSVDPTIKVINEGR